MIASWRQEISLHGHRLDVLKSGLQKYIRRGDLNGAMYCAGELDLFSDCGKDGERIRTNMIHRLMIIYVEDVGLGAFWWWKKVDGLVQAWLLDRTKVNCLQALVTFLCHAPKTRACSYARAFASLSSVEPWSNDARVREAHADYETYKDRLKDALQERKWVSILIIVRQLSALSSMHDYKRIIRICEEAGVASMDIATRWIKEIKTAERPLIVLLPVLNYLFPSKMLVKRVVRDSNASWNEHRNAPVKAFDDFVFDKHVRTTRGDVSNAFWLNTSSHVENEVFVVPKIFKRIYLERGQVLVGSTSGSLRGGKIERETDYPMIVRCQLVCSNSKTDSVIAKHGKELVFLKGPFEKTTLIEQFIKFQKEKKLLGIPSVQSDVVWLIPDRWRSTSLGIRNKLDLSKPWPFLRCKPVFDESRIRTCVRSSTKWEPTEVLDSAAMNLTIEPLKLNEEQLKEYVKAIKFRVKYNLGDLADRNFLLGDDGHVYSVDEEVVSKPINLETALKKKRYDLIASYL